MTRLRTATTRARRGAIFLITLATIVILAAMLLIFARNMRTEAVASANTLSATQADMIEQGAERWVLAVVEGTPGDSITITETPAEVLQVGTGYFWILRPDPTTDQEYGFGITDEAGKLNLNTPNLSEAQLLNLPGMTTDVAEPILDWVSGPNAPAQTSGAKNDYYESLQEPYDAKNGAFETVDELSMVKGITPLILYGYDLNHDGVLDATEQSIAGLASAVNSGDTDTRGIFNYVTCYSRDANASATGASTGSTTTQKVAVNSGNFNQLQQALTTTLGQTRATAIIGQLQSRMAPGRPPPWSSLGQFFTASGMSPTEFGQVFPQLTTTQRARTPAQGLININTASAQALGCLPGLQRSDGDSLVASRGSANVNDVTWFFTALQTNAKVATVADWITTGSYFYSADIVAVAGDGRSFKRARIVVDSRTTPALIVYRKDLTALGWPLPPEIRDDMRAGRPPRDAVRVPAAWAADWAAGSVSIVRTEWRGKRKRRACSPRACDLASERLRKPLKAFRQNKVLGLAIGETSLMAAEVVTGGKRPETRHMAEFVYPADVSPQTPAALGKVLATFLREHHFTAKSAVIGIPARWLVVKPKDVPPADASTLADLLRLQAEGEFSSELKDLVFDYAADPADKAVTSVLLIATAKKYIDMATEVCEAARLSALAVTPSVVALGAVTSEAVADDALVLTVGSGGAELTAQTGGISSAIRHLRSPGTERSFVGELRRAVSTMPNRSKSRELIVWGESGFSDESLGTDLGIKVRSGDLPVLGVTTTSASANGDGRKYAAAVALALTAVGDREPIVDFFHSRLAPPKTGGIPRWAYWAAMGLVACVALGTWAYRDLKAQQNEITRMQADLDKQKPMITAAEQFVSKVTLAQAWHAGNPRYLACLKDLSSAIPDDKVTYVTSVVLKGNTREKTGTGNSGGSTGGNPSAASMSTGAGILTGTLFGKTTDQEHAQTVLDRMRRMPQFSDVKPGGTTDVGRGKEVQYSITFTYTPPKPPADMTAPAAPAPAPPAK